MVKFLHAIRDFDKPLIGAVNGVAVGVGTTMLLHCDLVVAAETSVFSLPFAKLGVCPEAGSSLLLPALVGHQRAAELMLLGDSFDAQTARSMGLVNRVTPPSEYCQTAMALARRLASLPPTAIRTSKALMKQAQRESLSSVYASELQAFGSLLKGPEAKESMSAFLEKRAPDFSAF